MWTTDRRGRPVAACQSFADGVDQWYVPASNPTIRLRNLNVRPPPYLRWWGMIGAPQQVVRTVALEDYVTP
ncbi:hypothetical protein [Nocardia sp. NBC_00403]|uniref:hypothetical protein n=1 Tax=Nocardia sp. NBC_00403 TaxID=2975990 RepID=UPI002E216B8F